MNILFFLDADLREKKEMRKYFHQLLKIVLDIIGDVPSEELHSDTYLVYKTFSRSDVDDTKKKY